MSAELSGLPAPKLALNCVGGEVATTMAKMLEYAVISVVILAHILVRSTQNETFYLYSRSITRSITGSKYPKETWCDFEKLHHWQLSSVGVCKVVCIILVMCIKSVTRKVGTCLDSALHELILCL